MLLPPLAEQLSVIRPRQSQTISVWKGYYISAFVMELEMQDPLLSSYLNVGVRHALLLLDDMYFDN